MAYDAPTTDTGSEISGGYYNTSAGVVKKTNPTVEKTRNIAYNESTSTQIYAVTSSGTLPGTPTDAMPKAIDLTNTGSLPLMVIVGYSSYTADNTVDAADYLHSMLFPGETYSPPVRAVINSGADATIMFGTSTGMTSPDANEYTDSGADTDNTTASNNVVGSDSNTLVYLEAYTDVDNCDGNQFRIGDLIRINDEIMEVTAIGTRAALVTNTITVKRAMYGSGASGSHADDAAVRFPFFNAYHDYDKYTKTQTDSDGKFKCFNFFGAARQTEKAQGVVPGSVSIKFYESGYQSLGLSGITSGTDSALTASGSYWFKIAIDGGTAEAINFTVDSSNTNFGGTNGVIRKMQTALDDKYKNTASNTFEQKSNVGIVDGDIRFTSGTHYSTSAIALTAGVDGASASYNIFAQQNGRFPALANIKSAVAAKFPEEVVYDRITNNALPNTSAFLYDDGYGNLKGAGTGTINYDTGAIDFRGAPPNAEFQYSLCDSSAMSGMLNESTTARINSIVNIQIAVPNQKNNGKINMKVY